MWDVFFYLAVVMALAVLVIVGAFLLRTFLSGGDPKAVVGQFFRPKPLPRIGVVEQATLDSRRRLVLIRRDNVEHLIMTGGPVDVVIETGIGGVDADGAAREMSDTDGTRAHPVSARAPLGS